MIEEGLSCRFEYRTCALGPRLHVPYDIAQVTVPGIYSLPTSTTTFVRSFVRSETIPYSPSHPETIPYSMSSIPTRTSTVRVPYDFSFIVSLYVSDLPNVTISTVRVTNFVCSGRFRGD